MAYIEDRWYVKNTDGTRRQSDRYGKTLRWRVRYEDPDGRERSKSFARKPDAERFQTRVAADLLRGTYLDPELGKISLRKWAHIWLERQPVDDSTRERLDSRVKAICAGLGDMRLAQLAASPSAVQAWLNGAPVARSTLRGYKSTLSSICHMAVDDGRMARNPCTARSVRLPAVPERKVQPLDPVQLTAIRDALPARWQAMATAGAICGLRQGEIFALSPGDIDFLRRVIHVRRQVKIIGNRPYFAIPKGGKTRDVPLSPDAAVTFSEHLRAWPPAEVTLPWHEPKTRRHGKPVPVSLMFTTRVARKQVSRQTFNSRYWHAAVKAAGLTPGRENGVHLLRHTYASVLLANGVPILQVAEYLGHTDPAFTLRTYTHLMKGGDDAARKAADLAFTVPTPDSARRKAR